VDVRHLLLLSAFRRPMAAHGLGPSASHYKMMSKSLTACEKCARLWIFAMKDQEDRR
jgi:hypothetical protein